MKIFLPAPVYQPYWWGKEFAGSIAQYQAEKVFSRHDDWQSNVTWIGKSSSCLPAAVQPVVPFEDSPLSLHSSTPGRAAGAAEGQGVTAGGRPPAQAHSIYLSLNHHLVNRKS